MRIEIANEKADIFVSCFQNIKVFTDSVNIMFREGELYVQSLDQSMVMIFEMTLPSTWFKLYELTDEVSVTLGINTSIWAKVLSIREKHQNIILDTNGDHDTLSIKFYGDSENTKTSNVDKNLEIPLLDIESDLLDIPDSEYQVDIKIGSSVFANTVNQLKQFDDSVLMNCNEEEIHFISESSQYGKMDAKVSCDDIVEYAIEENGDITNSFSLKYIHIATLYQKLSDNLSISMSEGMPLKLEYKLEEDCSLRFFVAPKVNDDD